MKTTQRIVSVLLLLAMLFALFASCSSGKKKDDKKEPGPTEKDNYMDISEHLILRPYSGSSKVAAAAGLLKEKLIKYTGSDMSMIVDLNVEKESNLEILVGLTNRQASKDAAEKLASVAEKEAFIIDIKDSKIAIIGTSDDDTILAVKYFINNFVKTSPKNNRILLENGDRTILEKTGKILYMSDKMDAIVLDKKTTIFEPEPYYTNEYTYGKIIKLEHQPEEKNNGILFATNENTLGSPWDLYRSDDDGDTWQTLEKIRDEHNIGLLSGYQSYIYELPEAMGDYPKGTILFAGCSYGTDKTAIYLTASTDLGKTWTSLGNVVEGGGYNQGGWSSDGVWEPVLMYENGRLYCCFSDETENGEGEEHIGGHNQKLSYRYTDNLKRWTKTKDMVALGSARPGMIALTKMGNGKWALAFEYCLNGCPINIKFADTLDSWDASDKGTTIETPEKKRFGSGPAIAWTPNGGDNGTLLLTACTNMNQYTGSTKCDLFISFDYGETFISIDNPIPIKNNSKVRSGYSPGFYVDKNGDVYYVNDPELAPGASCGKLVFAKLKIY